MVIPSLFTFMATFFLGVAASDTHHFQVSHYEIKSKKIKKSFKAVVISDLHGANYGTDNQKLLHAVWREKPDMVLIPGDLIVGLGDFDLAPVFSLLRRLSRKVPVYMSLGNHEGKVKWYQERFPYSYESFLLKLKQQGVTLLDNDKIILPDYNLEMKGLTLPVAYYKRGLKLRPSTEELEQYCGVVDKDRFTLLLAHNPEYFSNYAMYGPDLTISGHLHGGIMRLPKLGGVISPRYQIFPGYTEGLYEEDGARMLVSRGLGAHTIPLRFFNPGELMVIDFKQE